MIADITGTVTNVTPKVTESGNEYRVVKILQMDTQGNGHTIPVRVWDSTIDAKVGESIVVCGVNAVAYVNKGKAGLSVDKWGVSPQK